MWYETKENSNLGVEFKLVAGYQNGGNDSNGLGQVTFVDNKYKTLVTSNADNVDGLFIDNVKQTVINGTFDVSNYSDLKIRIIAKSALSATIDVSLK